MSNIFYPVEGVDGKYKISPEGIVKNRENGRVVKQTLRSDGRVMVSLGGKQYLLHRLVWKAFGNGDKETQIGHRDGNRQNNHIDNLAPRSEITKAKNEMPKETPITEEQLVKAKRALIEMTGIISGAYSEFCRRKDQAGRNTITFMVDSKAAKSLLSLELISRDVKKIIEEL